MRPLNTKRRFPGGEAARLTVSVPDQPETDPVNAGEIEHVRWLMQMQADVAETLGGILLRGCRPVPIGTAPGGNTTPLRSAGRLLGWSVRETTGTAAATLRLWDGRDAANGKPLGYLQVAQGAVSNQFNGTGISVTDALFVEIVSGTVEGVLYLGAVD